MDTEANYAIEISLSKIKMIALLTGALLFVAAGIWFVKHPEMFSKSPLLITIIGYASIVFFGVCALFVVSKLFDTSPGFVIDSNGIVDNSSMFSVGFIPWVDIAGLSTLQIGRQKMIMIKVQDPNGYINRQPNALSRRAASINYRMYGSPIIVSTAALRHSFEGLYDKINEGWQKSGVTDRD
ncbi:STM3941 family protein [Mucilaginibacter phyllosphaerae]|uniref:PH domain-containing protein n=1 Tax=Mucilaginibacter phyllosphaerae TaxID=1812349 RepID=A0A4Y8ALP2_9SPHI|nr:STM3941 family protein [Mucilaginibacter phyllosphaerae]MBB3967612.1 hypothetical protein [Mucilaginibacter phyllosphaerae]TEW69331.1 hypothetical protein E2R65_03955 [Mucilaginibacter phyllosphaerae]GGH21691.1 hypothetical protein GCM10007352_34610 [Mucilaginibacter phyllosphaerae]